MEEIDIIRPVSFAMTQTKQAMQLLTLRIICGFYSFLPHCYTQHLLHAKVKNLYSNRYVRSKLIPIILLFYPGHAMGLRMYISNGEGS